MTDVTLLAPEETAQQCSKENDELVFNASLQEVGPAGHKPLEVASTETHLADEVTDSAFATAERESSGDGGSPLSIKLTRQKVMADDKEDYVRSAYYGTLMIG